MDDAGDRFMDERTANKGWSNYSLPRLMAMAVSPLALPKPRPLHPGMNGNERAQAREANQRHIQAVIETYIDRSVRTVMGAMIAYLLSTLLLGMPLMAVATGIAMLTAILHLTILLFWKQHLDNRFGPLKPPE